LARDEDRAEQPISRANQRLSPPSDLAPIDGYLKSVAQTAHVSRASSL
jgi:hypothetical protein